MVCIEKTASLKAFEHGKERERSLCLTDDDDDGTGILFEEPNPTGSRPSDLIGLYRKWQRTKRPQPGELGIGIQQLKRHARSAVAVVMVASSEQANAWRPGREEAVKAMGLVRGMVYSSRRETPTGEKEQQGRGGGRQGLHCGEANPNQRLGGTSGQRPSADSQC